MATEHKLQIITPDQHSKAMKERILIYGRAGIGKTRLALSLPESFGKIAYYAADAGSEFLSSIAAEKRKRVIVVKPTVTGDGANRAETPNPIKLFTQFAMTNWTALDPEIGTIVVDTYTKVALDTIRHTANSGSVTNEKHYSVGDPKSGGQVIPNRGDYLAIDSVSRGFLDMLFTHQADKHIVLVCHEDIKITDGAPPMGGPSHPGRQMTEYLPAQFNTVIRVIREPMVIPGSLIPQEAVIAVTEHDGRFIAKLRTQDEIAKNAFARTTLERDPSSYWTALFNSLNK